MAYVPTGAKRGRPRKTQPGDIGWEPDEAMREAFRRLGWKAPEEVSGASLEENRRIVNEHADRYAQWQAKYELAIASGSKEIPNLRAALEMEREKARANGVPERSLVDRRSDADKVQDAVDRVLEAPQAVLELADLELDALERGMLASIQLTDSVGYGYILKARDKEAEVKKGKKKRKAGPVEVKDEPDQAEHGDEGTEPGPGGADQVVAGADQADQAVQGTGEDRGSDRAGEPGTEPAGGGEFGPRQLRTAPFALRAPVESFDEATGRWSDEPS